GRTDHAEELDSTATKLGRLFTNSARPPGALGKESQQAEPGQRQRTPHGVDQDRDLPARGPWQLTREEGAWRRYTPSSIGFVIDNQGALAMIPRLSDGIKKRLTRSDRCQYGSCARNSRPHRPSRRACVCDPARSARGTGLPDRRMAVP